MSGVDVQVRGDVVELRLARPEKLNPLGPEEWRTIVDAIDDAERSGSVRAVVIRSTGRYFCAGTDLGTLRSLTTIDAALDYLCGTMLRGFIQLATTPLPVIIVIHADASGGGLELAHYGDYAIAADDVVFRLPEARRGLYPSTLVAASPAGYARSVMARMSYTGEAISAAEAQRHGLIQVAVPAADLDGAVDRALEGIRAASPAALAATKQHLNGALLRDGIPAVRRALEDLAPLIVSGDGRDGLEAFARREEIAWRPTGINEALLARRDDLVRAHAGLEREAIA